MSDPIPTSLRRGILAKQLVCLLSFLLLPAMWAQPGVVDPTQFAGNDIGAKINAAWKAGRTVAIPPGNYTFSTTIVHPGAGYRLQCDAGTVLNYTGSSDAITLGQAGGAFQNAGIDGNGGCQLVGTAAALSGIHLFPSNHTFIRNIRISAFTSGYAIDDTGANSVEIDNVALFGNKTGIYLTGYPGYAANAVHVSNSEIANNSNYGLDSENAQCACSRNLGNVVASNVFEGNGFGDLRLNWDYGTSVTGNYFESSGIAVDIGATENAWGTSVTHNYFTVTSSNTTAINIGYGRLFNIEENAELGTSKLGCFVNVTTGPNGAGLVKRGYGTNMVSDPHEWCNAGVATTAP